MRGCVGEYMCGCVSEFMSLLSFFEFLTNPAICGMN
jgi:hypothetical protein